MSRFLILATLVAGTLVAAAPAAQTLASMPHFVEATGASGITFRHTSGAFGKKYLPETVGSGAAFVDVDNDGWQDLLLINSRNWPGRTGGPS